MDGPLETYRGVVYPWQCDHMGHMNVMWYVGKFDEATWNLFAAIGMTAAFLRGKRRGMSAVQQNISYRRECTAGDTLSVHSSVREMREKVLRFVHEMRNTESGEIVAVCELTGVHIDTVKRKACPFPDSILQRGRELLRPDNGASR
jgi:acyl-CoA thioester hydrolase